MLKSVIQQLHLNDTTLDHLHADTEVNETNDIVPAQCCRLLHKCRVPMTP